MKINCLHIIVIFLFISSNCLEISKGEIFETVMNVIGPVTITINSLKSIDVSIRNGYYEYNCYNTTCCSDDYNIFCENEMVLSIKIISLEDDNYFTIEKVNEKQCSYLPGGIFLFPLFFIGPIFFICIVCIFFRKRKTDEILDEQIPLISVV